MSGLRVAMVCFAVLLIAAVPALTQSETASVTVSKRLFGDYQIIPGERLGNIRLGEDGVTAENFAKHYGLTRTLGFPSGLPGTWNYPEKSTGKSPGYPADQPFVFYFCKTNARLFATGVFRPAASHPDAQMLWLFHDRLRTPESQSDGKTFEQPSTWWRATYGAPVAILWDALDPPWNQWAFHLFSNGLFVSPSPNGPWMTYLGVYNLGVCRGETLARGTYVPFIGRVEIVRTALSKAGDPQADTIGEPLVEPKVRKSERVYFFIELTFAARPIDRVVPMIHKFVAPDGRESQEFMGQLTIKANETRAKHVFWLGGLPSPSRQIVGRWKTVLSANKVPIATIEFENTD